ncbi:MAG: glycerate kinase [Verrucomicrobiota bacterium]|nr:glycerate kinase [Verrucomicrobiota bacterium]
MRILVAPDKFKDSLGASEVAQNIAAGLREVLGDALIDRLPIADGGEGTAEVICAAAAGQWHSCEVHDPLGRIVTAHYCTIDDGAIAVMEMSEAAGLWRVAPNERDPMRATTFGVGEMLLDAARRGVREIIIGLGGSATNDGGFGMARALGFRFFDASGTETSNFLEAARFVAPNELSLPSIIAAVDVQNPLLGENGATRVFAPQKGASREQLELLEAALARFADMVGRDAANEAGAGAAGGLGFGLTSLCAAQFRSGFEVVAERIGLAEAVRDADVIITGEGRLDAQTLAGKAPAGVARLARAAGKRVFAIVGASSGDGEAEALFERVLVIGDIDKTAPRLRECARDLAQLFR